MGSSRIFATSLRIILLCAVSSETFARSNVWFNSKTQTSKAVVLALHGLNNRPESMDPISKWLAQNGFDVLRVSLTGHTGDIERFKSVTVHDWERDFLTAYQLAQSRSQTRRLPIFVVAYSLGAVTALSVLLKYPEVEVQKLVLFAPPISTKLSPGFIKWVQALTPDRLLIPSLNVKGLRAHRGTSVSAYSALMKMSHRIQSRTHEELPSQTLILLDPEDELLNVSGIEKWLRKNHDLVWKLKYIRVKSTRYSRLIHHLIIDPKAMQPELWKDIQKSILYHFEGVQ